MTQKRLLQIEKRIETIKAKLAAIGELRPGSLTSIHAKVDRDSRTVG